MSASKSGILEAPLAQRAAKPLNPFDTIRW